ncbi:uncharacterized protein METZ01_LOCUS457502 [marine metagenome]|uniref:Uncharacterized protein n=1 Tax=marine metagenome TaxID=408172 RepID=A0A383AC28_9ZZZZ
MPLRSGDSDFGEPVFEINRFRGGNLSQPDDLGTLSGCCLPTEYGFLRLGTFFNHQFFRPRWHPDDDPGTTLATNPIQLSTWNDLLPTHTQLKVCQRR